MGERKAGWYEDPLDPARERFWDGAGWSDDARPTTGDVASPGPLPQASREVVTIGAGVGDVATVPPPDTSTARPSPMARVAPVTPAEASSPDVAGAPVAGAPAADVPTGRRSRLVLVLGIVGVLLVLVVVAVGARLLGAGTPDADPAAEVGSLDVGDDGDLATGSVTGGERATVTLEVEEAGAVTIDVIGRDGFDPMVRLSRDGEVLEVNDDGPTGLDSRIQRDLDPGTYLVEVAGFGQSAGSFEVRITGSARLG